MKTFSVFRFKIKGMPVAKSDPEYQENKNIFKYLMNRVHEITAEGNRFVKGDSLMDETQTYEVEIVSLVETPARKDYTGVCFHHPGHLYPSKVLHYYRGGNWICCEPVYGTQYAVHLDTIESSPKVTLAEFLQFAPILAQSQVYYE